MCHAKRTIVSWIVVRLLFTAAPCVASGSTSGKQTLPGSLHFIALMAGNETRMVHLLNGCLLAGSLRARAELCTSFHSVLRCLSRAATPPKYVAPHHSQTPSAASSHPSPPAGVRTQAQTTTNRARESYETQGSCLRQPCNFKVGHKLFLSQHTPPHHQKHPH